MKKVMVFGAFDGLHPGHLDFFKQAKKYGDFLVVSVGRNVNVKKIKGKEPLFDEEERLELVSNLKIVDKAVLGAVHEFIEHIKMEAPDIICLGYDQWAKEDEVKIPAARLLDNLGWKGKRIGNVGTFATQALAVVNYGATPKEILDFTEKMREAVYKKYNIKLDPEVQIL